MKSVKSFKVLLLVLVLFGVATISANGKETRGIYFKQATYASVPGSGTCHYYLDSEHRDWKETTSKKASIKGKTSAWYGATTAIVNNVGELRSNNVVLDSSNNWTVRHPDTTASQGWSYYNRACTAPGEWNNTVIDVRYSADYID